MKESRFCRVKLLVMWLGSNGVSSPRVLRLVAVIAAAALGGTALAVLTFLIGLALNPPTCPRCTGLYCSLIACVTDFRLHAVVAALVGALAAGSIIATIRWLSRPRP